MRTPSFGVASFNAHSDALTLDQIREDLRRVMVPGVALVGLQEARACIPALRELADDGWGLVLSDEATGRQEPILYRRDVFRLIDSSSVMGCEGWARINPDRWINTADLIHRATSTEVALHNTHMNHHVEAWPWSPHARGYRKHMRRLRRLIREYDSETLVLVTMDSNVDQNARSWRWWWPQNALARVGAVSNYTARRGVGPGTLGRRFVDAVWIRHRSAVISGWRMIRGLHSDHRAVVATVTMR